MDGQEFQDVIKTLCEDHARVMKLIERMLPLSMEQKRTIAETLARQKREYDEYLKRHAEIKSKGGLALSDSENPRYSIVTYLREVETLVKRVFTFVPRLSTAARITIETPPTMRAYSMAVAPLSSARKRKTRVVIPAPAC
jgi:hypothetical protein